MNGIERIAAERRRQIETEGWTPEHDDAHSEGEMALAAAYYAIKASDICDETMNILANHVWPASWSLDWRKPKSHIRNLERAGALIAAEIDRLLRQAQKGSK